MATANTNYRLAIAGRYWLAAHTCLSNISAPTELWEPLGFIHGFSAELALKCFLERKGVSAQVLKKPDIRHNLSKLCELSLHNHMPLTAFEVEILLRMTPSHNSHFFRYGTGDFDPSLGVFKIPLYDILEAHVTTAQILFLVSHNNQNTMMLEANAQFAAQVERAKSSPEIDLQQFNALKAFIEAQQKRFTSV